MNNFLLIKKLIEVLIIDLYRVILHVINRKLIVMKYLRNVLFCCFLLAFVFNLYGQKTAKYNFMEELWETASGLYDKGMYVPAQKLFMQILMHNGVEYSAYKDEAAYYVAMCALNLFNYDAEYQLINFLELNPESSKTNSATFQMGNYYFRNKKYKEALEWYEKVKRVDLTADEQSEYFFKMGFSHFARKDFDKAAKSFYESRDANTIYGPMSLYFYSHIKYINQQYQTALNGFLKLESNPSFKDIVPFYISQIYYLMERYQQVTEYAPKLLEGLTGAEAAEIAKIIGMSYYRLAKYNEAVQYLQTYMRNTSSPTDYDYYELGYSFYNLGKYSEAAANFTKIKSLQDTLSQYAYYHLGDCYLKLENKVEARKSFEMASKYNFNPVIKEDALFNFAQLSFELSMSPFNEAINAFNKYIKEYPNSPRVGKAYDYLVDAFLSTKNYQGAISVIENMKNRTPKIDAAYQRLTYFRGLEHFIEQKFNEAITMFEKSLEYKIYDREIAALANYWRAEANYRLGKTDLAISQFKEFVSTPTGSVKLDEFSKAHYNLGYLYFNKKEYATANSWFRKFEMQPGNENTTILNDALNRIGDCYFISKEFAPAAEYYKKAVAIGKIVPDYSLYQLALSYSGLKQPQQKIWSLRRVVNEFPESEYAGNANFEIGRTYHVDLNRTDSAKFYYNRVIVNYPKSSVKRSALTNIGAIYFSENNYNKALEVLKQVIAEYPGTEEAANANQMIKDIYIAMENPGGYIEYVNNQGSGVVVSEDEQDEILWLSAKKLYIDKKYNEALNALKNYLNKFPNGKYKTEAHYFKAELHFYFEEKDLALPSYRIVADAPRNSFTEESMLKAASILFDKNDFATALSYYEKLYPISENKSTKFISAIGRMRCAYNINDWDKVIPACVDVIENEKSNEEQKREAHYKMAKAYYAKNNTIRALGLFEKLSTEVRSPEGAEAMYRRAEINFKMKKDTIAEDLIFEFAQKNSPQAYWLAKSFILLSDIYAFREDYFSAKHALQNLLSNYPNETDGIKDEASEKLTKILEDEQAAKGQESMLNLKINLIEDSKDENLFIEEDDKIDLPKPAEMR